MKKTGIPIKGYSIDKTGKLKASAGRKSVSTKIRERKSKRVRPAKKQGMPST